MGSRIALVGALVMRCSHNVFRDHGWTFCHRTKTVKNKWESYCCNYNWREGEFLQCKWKSLLKLCNCKARTTKQEKTNKQTNLIRRKRKRSHTPCDKCFQQQVLTNNLECNWWVHKHAKQSKQARKGLGLDR
jgi:hypothetical protein